MKQTNPQLVEMREAIVREPGCDTVRLAYADLLDEIGGPANQCYAKFIRLCIKNHIEYGQKWMNLNRLQNDHNWVEKRIKRYHRNWIKTTCGPMSRLGTTFDLPVSGLGFRSSSFLMRFERGFLSHVRTSWDGWSFWYKFVSKDEPFSSVELNTLPPFPMERQTEIEEHDRSGSIRRITLSWLQAKWPLITTWVLPK